MLLHIKCNKNKKLKMGEQVQLFKSLYYFGSKTYMYNVHGTHPTFQSVKTNQKKIVLSLTHMPNAKQLSFI